MAKKFTRTQKDKYKYDQAWSKKWEATRNKGMLRYIFVNGIMWGIITSVVFQLLIMFSKGFQYENIRVQLINPTLSIILAGLFFGVSTWMSSESKYSKVTNSRTTSRR